MDIVFEHPGRETFGAAVYVARKGGTVVTCASTSGYQHSYDNRNVHQGKVGILALAPSEGLGVRDPSGASTPSTASVMSVERTDGHSRVGRTR